MTPEQFKAVIEELGLALSDAAILLGVHPRTTRRWANAERKVPPPVVNFLRHLAEARTKSAKAARVPRARKTNGKIKTRVGPTFVCEFTDGTVTRMSTFTALENLDWGRGERLSIAAWQSRWRAQYRKQNGTALIDTVAPVPPAIVAARFEQDGVVLAQRNGGNAS